MGWNIKKVDNRTYEFYHKTNPRAFDDVDLDEFVSNVTSIDVTYNESV